MTVTREYAGKGYLICTGSGERLLRKRLSVVKERERETGLVFRSLSRFYLLWNASLWDAATHIQAES